ncbi:MAG TPA: hypothetical protein VHG71_09380 [Verrucomicrobiae bacterium]|nr:hypothetical protein [Verrucomicrobiae bacterium]
MKHEKYPAASGKARGKGLMPGSEMVKDRAAKVPARAECQRVLENARTNSVCSSAKAVYGDKALFRAAHVHPSGRRGFSARSSG